MLKPDPTNGVRKTDSVQKSMQGRMHPERELTSLYVPLGRSFLSGFSGVAVVVVVVVVVVASGAGVGPSCSSLAFCFCNSTSRFFISKTTVKRSRNVNTRPSAWNVHAKTNKLHVCSIVNAARYTLNKDWHYIKIIHVNLVSIWISHGYVIWRLQVSPRLKILYTESNTTIKDALCALTSSFHCIIVAYTNCWMLIHIYSVLDK